MRETSAFADAIRAAGFGAPSIVADGEIHRFRDERDKAGTRNAWYVLHLDGTAAGAFGSWRTGEQHTWTATSREARSPAELANVRAIVAAAQARRREETEQRQAEAAARVRAQLEYTQPASPGHPYLTRKRIRPHGARLFGESLFLPIRVGREITSAQTITPAGNKRFAPGGQIKGGCFLLNDETTRAELVICEGFATGATLHEETGAVVYVAFNAGNLLDVARHAREINPDAPAIIAADNDAWTPGNPGMTKAHAAARAIGAKVLMPDFTGMDTSDKPTDWNDWYRLRKAGVAA